MTNLQLLLSRPGVKWIMLVNLILFPIGFMLGGENFSAVGLIPAAFMAKLGSFNLFACFADLIRFQFFHAGFWHIFINLLFLFTVGMALEANLGLRRFLILYMASGIVAGLAYALFAPLLPAGNLAYFGVKAVEKCLQYGAAPGAALEKCLQSGIPLIGASGAIAGLMGAVLVITREQPIYDVPVLNFTLKAKHFIFAWLSLQIFTAIYLLSHSNPAAGEAIVHLCGLAAGFAIARHWDSRMTDTASTTPGSGID